MDLDLDDLGLGDRPSQATSRPSRFIPKSSKLKAQPKTEPSASEVVAKPEPEVKPNAFIPKKQEDSKPPLLDSAVNNNVTEAKVEEEVVMAVEEQLEEEPMEVDTVEEEEDGVVREIDVFFSPSPFDSNTQLYVLQYPLRPCWRPYELDQKCQEVRVKPKSMQVEIDLSLDVDKNYNTDVAEKLKITTQTLSSRKAPLTTGYAVGVLVGDKLYLNPVNAVVQLRPSMEHLKSDGLKKKNSATQNAETATKSDQTTLEKSAGPSKTQGKLGKMSNEQDTDGDETWVSLEYYGTDSIFSSRHRQKMTAQDSTPIPFSMNMNDYLNSLCPGSSTESNRMKGPSRRFFLSLPLEERFKMWFSKVSQVNRFSALQHLAPDHSDEDILGVLQRYADLVQGLWVTKTPLLPLQGVETLARDYALLLFRNNPVITQMKIDGSQLFQQNRLHVLFPLAVKRPKLNDWKFKEPTDLSFIKGHPDIVREQEQLWGIREKKITEIVHGSSKSGPSRNSVKNSSIKTSKLAASTDFDEGGAKKSVSGATASTVTMSDETREALPKALEELFRRHKVCSLQLIRQGLRDLAISKSTLPKLHSKAARAAALGADVPPSELQSVISQVAILIHGVYVSKSSENRDLNPLRTVVINLFSANEPNAKLKKADIVEAAKIALKRDITTTEYTQVVSELCVSVKGNAWVLKSGDGNAK